MSKALKIHKPSEEYYFSVNSEVYYTIRKGKAIIFSSLSNSFYKLNAVGTQIWELADRTHRIKEAIDIIAEDFGINRDRAAKDVLELVVDLYKKNLLCLSKQRRQR